MFREVLLWTLIGVQLVLAFFLVRIIVRLALLTFFHRQTLPYVPISRGHIRLILESGELQSAKTIVDLGCGDGVLLAAIAKAYPQAELAGVEHGVMLAWLARLRFFVMRRAVTIVRGDMFAYPVHDANAIVGFWISDLTPRLVEKFVSECKTGCVIISAMFSLPPHPQLQMQERREGKNSIFIYRKV